MGRWGDGIFEGDLELDIISEIFPDELCEPMKEDVIRLRSMAWEREQLSKKSDESKGDTRDSSNQNDRKPSKEELEEDWFFDVSVPNPRFPRLVRDFLDSGVLAFLIDQYGRKRANSRWTESQHMLVLLAYCAMQLGCTLPRGFLRRLKSNYHRVGLYEGGNEQMRRACDEYIDGKPYEFTSVGLLDVANMSMHGDFQRPEPRPPGLEPIPAQETMSPLEESAHEESARKRRKVEPEVASTPVVEEFDFHFPADTCANCGATKGYGQPDLKRCKGCKTTLYCFEGCEKWHWFRHRRQCALDQKDEDSTEGKSADRGEGLKDEPEQVTA